MQTAGEEEVLEVAPRPAPGSNDEVEARLDTGDDQDRVALRPETAVSEVPQDSTGSTNQCAPSTIGDTGDRSLSTLSSSPAAAPPAAGAGITVDDSAGGASTPAVGDDPPAQGREPYTTVGSLEDADGGVAPSATLGNNSAGARAHDESANHPVKQRHHPTPLSSKQATALTNQAAAASPSSEALVHRQRAKAPRDGTHAGQPLASGHSSSADALRTDRVGQDEHLATAGSDGGGGIASTAHRDKRNERADDGHIEESVPFADAQALAPPLPGAVRVHPSSTIVALSVEADDEDEEEQRAVSAGVQRSPASDSPSEIIHHRQDDEGDGAQSVSPMVEASLVTEPTLVEASPIDLDQLRGSVSEAQVKEVLKGQARKRRRLWILICLLATTVVILVVGISLGMTLGSQESQMPEVEAYLRSVIPNSTLLALEDPGSPQYQAMQWVKDDNFLSDLDVEEKQFRLKQRFALAVLFYAMDTGSPWFPTKSNWLVRGSNECDWAGCRCSRQGAVESISVRGLITLLGFIPPEIGLLDQLVTVDGGNTSIVGQLPSEIGALTHLSDLRLDHSLLSGTIPSEFGLLTNLEVIHFHKTSITGTIPTEFGALTRLRRLRFDTTSLNGMIPSEFGLANLTEFSLKYTSVDGTIPSELGLLSNLDRLELHETSLRGTVPEEVCRLVERATLNISVTCFWVSCDCACVCGEDLLFDDGAGQLGDDMNPQGAGTGGDDAADDY